MGAKTRSVRTLGKSSRRARRGGQPGGQLRGECRSGLFPARLGERVACGRRGDRTPRSASLAAQAGPAATMRPGRAARASGVTVTVMKPGPVTSARAMPPAPASRAATRVANGRGCSPEANATLEAYCPGVPVGRRPGSAGQSPSSAIAARSRAARRCVITRATRAGRRPARGPRGSSRRGRRAWSGRRPRRRWRPGRCRPPGRGR